MLITHKIIQYAENDELGNVLLPFTNEDSKDSPICESLNKTKDYPNKVRNMYFDRASSKDGSRDGILLISPTKDSFYFSFKLNYDITNNVVEY